MDIFAPAKKMLNSFGPRGAEANAADMVERRRTDLSEVDERIEAIGIVAIERAEDALAERELHSAARAFGALAVAKSDELEFTAIDLTDQIFERELVSID